MTSRKKITEKYLLDAIERAKHHGYRCIATRTRKDRVDNTCCPLGACMVVYTHHPLNWPHAGTVEKDLGIPSEQAQSFMCGFDKCKDKTGRAQQYHEGPYYELGKKFRRRFLRRQKRTT